MEKSIKIKNLAVIVSLENGNTHQVALGIEEMNYLISELPDYFKGGKIQLIEKPLSLKLSEESVHVSTIIKNED